MIYLFATFLFVSLQGFFSGIETGLVSLQHPRVKHGVDKNLRRAKILEFFIKRPGFMLATTLLGTNICVVCSSVSAKNAVHDFGFTDNSSIIVATIVMTFILLIIEIIPKNWFRQAPYERCMMSAYFLYGAYCLLFIPAFLLSKFTEKISRIFSSSRDDANTRIMLREDFRLLLRDSESEGIIDRKAADILDNAIDFNTLRAGEVMVLRKNVKEIEANQTILEAINYCKEKGVSRVPVFAAGNKTQGSELNQWIGVFSIYDAFFTIPETSWATSKIITCLRPVNQVTANADMNEVLAASKRFHSPLLVVTDSADQTRQLGIVTPLDAVRKLFG